MFHIKKNLKELYGIKRYSLGCWGKGLCTKGAQWWQTPSESTWKSRPWICRLEWKLSLSPDLPGTGLWPKGPSVRGEARGSLGPCAVCSVFFFSSWSSILAWECFRLHILHPWLFGLVMLARSEWPQCGGDTRSVFPPENESLWRGIHSLPDYEICTLSDTLLPW